MFSLSVQSAHLPLSRIREKNSARSRTNDIFTIVEVFFPTAPTKVQELNQRIQWVFKHPPYVLE